jgi:hypothetical protein
VSTRLAVADFDVRAMMPSSGEADLARERIVAALALIRAASPTRYAYLRRDLPRILIGATHNRGECHFPVEMCLLGFDYVVGPHTTPQRLAVTLIHEGTHARLARAGLRYQESLRARIERICVAAEMLVATRFPDGERVLADVTSRLPRPDADWSDDALRERGLQAMRELGAFGRIGYWIGRALTLLVRGRSQRAA